MIKITIAYTQARFGWLYILFFVIRAVDSDGDEGLSRGQVTGGSGVCQVRVPVELVDDGLVVPPVTSVGGGTQIATESAFETWAHIIYFGIKTISFTYITYHFNITYQLK